MTSIAVNSSPILTTPAVHYPAQTPDPEVKDNLSETASNNYLSFDLKQRFFDTVSSVKKLMKRFKTTQKITARADLFSKPNSLTDPLKIISVATLPFLVIELYRTIKKVCEVSMGISISDPLSDKVAFAGTAAIKVGKGIYDTADSAIKCVESTIKPLDFAVLEAAPAVASTITLPKVLGAALLPFRLFDMYGNVEKICKIVTDKSIVHLKDKFSRVTDQALSIIDNCVDITQIVASFIANNAVVTVAGFLSAINIVVETKKFYDSIEFHIKISNRNFSVIDTCDYDFKRNLNPSDKIKCILRADGDKEKEVILREIKKKLVKRFKSDHSEAIDQIALDILEKISPEKIHSAESVQKATKLRSIQMITCHALKGLAASVNITAAAILFAAPPLAPASYALVGVSSLISLGAFIFDSFAGRRWENAIVSAVKKVIVQTSQKLILNDKSAS